MSVLGSTKAVVASAVAGTAILAGGFLIGGALASAEEGVETPVAGHPSGADEDGGSTGTARDGECDKDGSGGSDSGAAGGIGHRGAGRTLRR